jgi:trehalose-6-phosphatase
LPRALIALDFDGTLAEISPRPQDAQPLRGAPMLLGQIRAAGARVAVITGRTTSSDCMALNGGTMAGRKPLRRRLDSPTCAISCRA